MVWGQRKTAPAVDQSQLTDVAVKAEDGQVELAARQADDLAWSLAEKKQRIHAEDSAFVL
jgi:hypothetical protein